MKRLFAILFVAAGLGFVAVYLDKQGMIDLTKLREVIRSGDTSGPAAVAPDNRPAAAAISGRDSAGDGVRTTGKPAALAGEPAPETLPPLRAPPGVYYLLNRQSITLPDGIIGFDAGTQVRLMRVDGTNMVVKMGRHELSLDEKLLTNDLRKLKEIMDGSQSGNSASAQPAPIR